MATIPVGSTCVGRGAPHPASWVMLENGIVNLVQVVVRVRSLPKSFEQAVQTPPTGSVLRSGTFTRTAEVAPLEPFLA